MAVHTIAFSDEYELVVCDHVGSCELRASTWITGQYHVYCYQCGASWVNGMAPVAPQATAVAVDRQLSPPTKAAAREEG